MVCVVRRRLTQVETVMSCVSRWWSGSIESSVVKCAWDCFCCDWRCSADNSCVVNTLSSFPVKSNSAFGSGGNYPYVRVGMSYLWLGCIRQPDASMVAFLVFSFQNGRVQKITSNNTPCLPCTKKMPVASLYQPLWLMCFKSTLSTEFV